ncbi:MAG: hypothetical protein M3416_08200 [Acidobacteriota bacterium]|nr:hypothetical protein [Acidobacteriota bacterium]
MAEQTNVQETSCGLRGFERNRYFFGKQLTVRDFDAEQSYFNGKRYLLNRLVHSWGVVCGLRVEPQAGGRFKLGPGAAIDCCGREIIVGDEDLVYSLADLEGYERLAANQPFYVCLKYDECVREPVQTVANVSSCTDVCDYNRIREGFSLFVTTAGPKPGPGMDFCGLTTESRVLARGSTRSLKVERVVPRWVNPKEVFEVLVVATATRQEGGGTITLKVDEDFIAGALTLAQGPDDMSFTLPVGPTDTRVEQRYMVRAGAAAGEAVIGCNIRAVSGSVMLTPEPNRNSEVEVVEGAVADRLVQTFFEGDLSVCPSCAEDHCLYLAGAVLGADDELKEMKPFPTNQYVYNNELLYDLLSCGGRQRLGKVPEVPALGQAGETVVPAVNSMKFFDGVKVARTGDGRADISANVAEGLTVAGGKIVSSRGDGIKLDAGRLAAKLGRGLDFDNPPTLDPGNSAPTRPVAVKNGDGLNFDANNSLKVNVNTQRGLGFDEGTPTRAVVVKEGAGLGFENGALRVNADEGVTVSNDTVVANVGDGLDLQNKKIVVNAGDGLTFPPGQAGRRAVAAKLGKGLDFDAGAPTKAIVVKEGEGLGFDADNRLKVNTGQGVTTVNDTVVANVGDGLNVRDGRIVVNPGGGLKFGATDPKQITANVGNGLTVNNSGVIVPQYSTGRDAGRVCEANDERLSNRREPTPHKEKHQARGEDQIDVTELPGLLKNAQKVEVQKDLRPVGTEQRLNFTGKGVSVSDEPSAQRVNINIPGGVEVEQNGQGPVAEGRRLNFTGAGVSVQGEGGGVDRVNINIPGGGGGLVTTGEVTFTGVAAGERRFIPVNHGLGDNDVAFVLCYLDELKLTPDIFFLARVFGSNLAPLTGSSTPLFYAIDPVGPSPEGPDVFYVYVIDQRPPTAAPVPRNYTFRWWAIAAP